MRSLGLKCDCVYALFYDFYIALIYSYILINQPELLELPGMAGLWFLLSILIDNFDNDCGLFSDCS